MDDMLLLAIMRSADLVRLNAVARGELTGFNFQCLTDGNLDFKEVEVRVAAILRNSLLRDSLEISSTLL